VGVGRGGRRYTDARDCPARAFECYFRAVSACSEAEVAPPPHPAPPKSGGARLGGAPRITREAEFAAPSRAVRLYATQVLAGVPGGDAAVLHLTAETEGERVRPSSSVILTLSFLLAFPSGKIWCLLVLLLSALSFRG